MSVLRTSGCGPTGLCIRSSRYSVMSSAPTGTSCPVISRSRAASRVAIGTPRVRTPTSARRSSPRLRSTISCAIRVSVRPIRSASITTGIGTPRVDERSIGRGIRRSAVSNGLRWWRALAWPSCRPRRAGLKNWRSIPRGTGELGTTGEPGNWETEKLGKCGTASTRPAKARGMQANSIEEFEVWQRSVRLGAAITAIVRTPPLCRDLPLRTQSDECVDSILSNLEEGFEQGTDKAFARYVYIARGSCREIRGHLLAAQLRGHLAQTEVCGLQKECEDVRRLMTGLIHYLLRSDRTATRSAKPPTAQRSPRPLSEAPDCSAKPPTAQRSPRPLCEAPDRSAKPPTSLRSPRPLSEAPDFPEAPDYERSALVRLDERNRAAGAEFAPEDVGPRVAVHVVGDGQSEEVEHRRHDVHHRRAVLPTRRHGRTVGEQETVWRVLVAAGQAGVARGNARARASPPSAAPCRIPTRRAAGRRGPATPRARPMMRVHADVGALEHLAVQAALVRAARRRNPAAIAKRR